MVIVLQSPKKDGNDQDTITVTVKEGETLDGIAESMMGNASQAQWTLPHTTSRHRQTVLVRETNWKFLIQLSASAVSNDQVEGTRFSEPENFGTPFKKGDQYKLRFESNVDGNLYVYRKGVKGVVVVPAPLKKSKRNKNPEPLMRDSGKVTAYDPILIPIGKTGFAYNPKNAGDMIYVFLSLRKIPELEDLKTKPTIKVEDIEDVMHRVKEGEIKSDPPLRLLRISDPSEVLGFTLNIDG